MDVRIAFLNGTSKKQIHIKVSEDVKTNGKQVCKLNYTLYMLR